jgi:metal-responsive CopG/Arc/MetJ family transcriptional regulator
MLMSIPVNTKSRGRPAGREYVETIAVRMKREQAETLDAWIEAQPDKPSRSEAVRRLVDEALRAKRS